jgi:hypothetical protein
LANDRFLIRKPTFSATASNDDTWPDLAVWFILGRVSD